jgi:cytochrome c553
MACHGPSGAGNPGAKYPALRGQQSMYVVKQLQDFRSGTRSNDPAKMMSSIAARMSDADINAVAEYIAGLH